MEDLALSAFRISQEYMDSPKTCVHPVLLGFTEEERAWTNQERTLEELADFVMQDPIRQQLLYTAFYGNTIGRSGFECHGAVVKTDGKYWFQADSEAFRGYTDSDTRFELPDNENSALYDPMIAAVKTEPDSLRAFVVFVEKEEETGYYVILRSYPGIGTEEADRLFRKTIFLDLLKAADIHNFKQLGKFMNRSQKLFAEGMG